MKEENAKRVQTSFLNPIERVALAWLVKRQPAWVTSDMLTYFGLFGAMLIAAGYLLTNWTAAGLWLASLGFVFHWYGDSLDGTLARFRQQSRPLYGFYMDHNMDCITEFFIFGGMGLSAYMHFWTGLLMLVVYLAMEVYVMICAHLKNEFKLTYSKFGPTETRVFAILVNTIYFFVPAIREACVTFPLFGESYTLRSLDFMGFVIVAVLCSMYFSSLVADGRYFAKIDPLKKRAQA